MVKNTTITSRTKHVKLKFHYVKEKIKDNTAILQYILPKKMAADGPTKKLSTQKHDSNLIILGTHHKYYFDSKGRSM